MLSLAHPSVRRYAVAILVVFLAFVLMQMLIPWIDMAGSPFLLLFGAVMFSAWYGGIKPGLLATILSGIVSSYFLPKSNNTSTLEPANLLPVILFVLQGIFVSLLCQSLRTAQRQAEINLRSQQLTTTQVTHILESMTDSVIMLNQDWRFTYVNHHAALFLQLPRQDLLGQNLWEVFPGLVGSVFEQTFHQAVNERVTVTIEAPSPVSGRWVYLRAYPSSEGLAVYFQDIDERKQAEQAIVRLNRQLEHQKEAVQASEARYERLVANVPGVMYQFQLSANQQRSHFPYMSSRCFELLGYGADEIQQHPEFMWDAIYPDDLAAFQQSLDASAPTGSQWQHEWRMFTRSGQLKWIRGVSRAERQADGSVLWDGILMDITAEKQVADRFRRIFESNMIGINFADATGRIVFANDAFLNLIGYTQADLRQQQLNWRDLSPPESLAIDNAAAFDLIHHGVCAPYEKEYIRKDGSRIPVIVGAARLESPEQGCICFVVDISDRKQLENQLRQQAADLDLANRAKDEFFAILSHELRTPLNSILGWSQLLNSRKLDAQTVHRGLEAIERNAQTQAQLVDDLLDIARILQQRLELKRCPVNLVVPLEAAIESIRPLIHEKRIQLEVTVARSNAKGAIDPVQSFEVDGQPSHLQARSQTADFPDFIISGDSKRLQQIIWNLLSNAVKFTAIDGQIDITLTHLGNEVEIKVQDTGIGIDSQFMPQVFEPFRQADSSNTRHFGGLGLGLAIVRQLVELHCGTIKAESPGAGQGATFTITLPLDVRRNSPIYSSQGITTSS